MLKTLLTSFIICQSSYAASEYETLQINFNSASAPLTTAELSGGYIGRCFSLSKQNPAEDSILLTKKYVYKSKTASKNGPLFSNDKTKWEMIILPKQEINSQADAEKVCKEDGVFSDMTLVNSIAKSNYSGVVETKETLLDKTAYFEVKKGIDGYFYAKTYAIYRDLANTKFFSTADTYCYFWERL